MLKEGLKLETLLFSLKFTGKILNPVLKIRGMLSWNKQLLN